MKTLKEIANDFGIVRSFYNGAWIPTIPDWDYVLSIPEFEELATKNTTSHWHQEKNMFTHTQMVCKEMQTLIHDANKEKSARFSDDEMLVLMLAALFHDVGKCKCGNTPEGKLLSNGHPLISERICRKLLWGIDVVDREHICEMVRLHDLYCLSDISDRKLKTKISKMSMWMFLHLDMLFLLWQADDHGAIKDKEHEGSSERMIARVKNLMDTCEFHHAPMHAPSADFTIYVMCGLPGSGKSTWVQDNLPNLPVISRDDIREELGMTEKGVKFMGTPEQEDLVSKISDGLVNELCRHRKSFVYDNMNSREKYRRSFYDKVRKFSPIVRYIYLEVSDLELLKSRRPEIAEKGETVFEDMVYKMEFPRPDEYDTMTIFQNLSDASADTAENGEIGVLHLQNYKDL